MLQTFKPGDPVICRRTKTSTRPGPRAKSVFPATHGDTYSYYVDKFWRVRGIAEDGRLILVTRRGKEHIFSPTDPSLARPGLIARLFYRRSFPAKPAES